MNVKINKENLKDKILGCWTGKNIGGTVGGPFEFDTQMNDITGFTTPKGEPLPNDDLDLQLAWLTTLERVGAKSMDANDLADSWIMMISPHWNEYGVCKKNLELGLLPPMSGEYDNNLWKNSNGAWIRTELWACLAPGFPNIAIKYAIMDASVDHGLGEGTIAAIFTAAMQSIAFVENDVRKIIETALGYIPEDSRVAQCVRLVINEYDKGTSYRDTRNMIVEMTKDLGMFQAPNNLGFVTIGLLYGEGDFKKSILYATHCGDDADCTAGTVGATLGIIYGNKNIPEDWKDYIGDRIMQVCINQAYIYLIPKTCSEFTDRIMKRVSEVLETHEVDAILTDGETVYSKEEAWSVLEGYASKYYNRKPYSFDINWTGYLVARVEFDQEPVAKSGEEIQFTVKFKQLTQYTPMRGDISIVLPAGWTAEYRKAFHIARTRDLMEYCADYGDHEVYSDLVVTIIPGENISATNRILVNVDMNTRSMPFSIPVTILG